MFWVWANEPTADDEAMIYDSPSVIEGLKEEFDDGKLVTVEVPLIEISRDEESQGVLADNLIVVGVSGTLFSSRLRNLLASLKVTNLQYFNTMIRNPADGTETSDYQVANILGRVSCLDHERSVLKMSPRRPGRIASIDSLAIDEPKAHGFDLFRLHEFTQIIIASHRVKEALEQNQITGIRFYKPEDFVL